MPSIIGDAEEGAMPTHAYKTTSLTKGKQRVYGAPDSTRLETEQHRRNVTDITLHSSCLWSRGAHERGIS